MNIIQNKKYSNFDFYLSLFLLFFFAYSNAVLRNVTLIDGAVSGMRISAYSVTIPEIISGSIIEKRISVQYCNKSIELCDLFDLY